MSDDPGRPDEAEVVKRPDVDSEAELPPIAPFEEGDALAEVRRSWKVRRRLVVLRRRVRQSVVAGLVLLLLSIGFIAQTGQGQDLALRTALNRVQSSLSGQLTVDGVRSGTLLAGATLTGVRLVAADGRPFLSADSVVVRYSIPAAISGGRPIRSTVFWGLDLEISRYTSDQGMNITRLLAEGGASPAPDTSGTSQPISLGRVGIRESRVRILAPTVDRAAPRIVEGPEGEILRELAFEALDIDVEDAVLSLSEETQFTARLASFSSRIGVLEEPLVIHEAFGLLSFGDRGIIIEGGQFRLPGGLIEGDLTVGPEAEGEPWTMSADLQSSGWMQLSDIAWTDPRIPEGRFRGATDVVIDEGVHLVLRDVEVELEASSLVFDGAISFADEVSLTAMDVTANPIPLERLEPWIEQDIPLDGWLSGDMRFAGTLTDLTTSGRVTLVPTGLGGTLTTAEFEGTLHRGDNPGATDFVASLGPMNYDVLSALWPDLPWAGSGSSEVRLDGRVNEGLSVIADLEHTSATELRTVARVDGMFWWSAEFARWTTDTDVEFRPLSVGLLDGVAPELQLSGEAWGSISVDGPLDDAAVTADLAVSEGRIQGRGRIDLGDPTAAYRMEVEAEEFPLFALSTLLPERTMWSGSLGLDGSGMKPDSMMLDVVGSAYMSRYGDLRIDTLSAGLRIRNGVLIADSLSANVGGVDVVGRGRLGLVEGRYGSTSLDFSADRLVGLRPALMGVADSIIVQEELTPLDREFLRLQGVEPDTFPRLADVQLDGSLVGAASISGHLGDIDVGVIARFEHASWKENGIDSARVALTATGLPATQGRVQVGVSAFGIDVAGRRFEQGGFEADMLAQDGEGRLDIVRRPGEQYHAIGSFVIDADGGSVDMDSLDVQVDEQRWSLVRPAHVEWDERSVTVDSLEIARTNEDPMRLVADGVLARGGGSDFRLDVSGLHAEQIVHVAQLDRLDVGGHVDLGLVVRGPAGDPVMESEFRIDGPRYGTMELTRVDGEMEYRGGEVRFDVEGLDGTRVALRAEGSFPADLGLVNVEQRVRDEAMRFDIVADSLDAAIALSYVSALESVVGSVSGDVSIGGTPNDPAPRGELILSDAAWSIEAIGVRHTGVNGTVTLRDDRSVDVELSASGNGRSDVTGTVLLQPVSDPTLDLRFAFDRFLAVSRPDMEGSISGSFDLGGRYSLPLAQGALTVDEGAIYVDELQRAAGVVNLNDPFLFESGLAIDTTALISQPLFEGLGNPFFDNLRVDVDLSVPRGSWLRSIDSDVEMSGELLVRYDRTKSDFVLIGELEAVRGSHRVLGRTFELDGGRVLFPGRPGLNPDLSIQASSRIRRQDEPPLEVDALVEGTLVQPVVTLTTEEVGLAEEDLVSYLVFGQPSGALGTQRGGAGAPRSNGVVSSAVQGTVTFVGGVLTNQFGSAVTRDFLDYISVQQSGGVQSLGGNYVADTQLELGRYVGDDVFAVMVLRLWDAVETQNTVAGLRVEWALTDDYNVEGFLEDRDLRSGSFSLGGSSGLENADRIWGVLFFREWGYNPKRNSTEQN